MPRNLRNTTEPTPPREWTACKAAAIIALTLLLYVPAMRADFIWDDDAFLTDNPHIKAPDGLYRFWFTTRSPDYFPLTSSMLWVEWRLWGMNATGYHVVNVLLHAVSSVLLWRVLRQLSIPGAWLAGLVFAVHPVNVESVAWITERKNTLPMVFFLLATLLYLKSENGGHRRWYGLSLLSFLLGLLAKTSIVMLPAVLLGCAWWRRGQITRKDLLRVLPFFGLAVVLSLVTVWFQYNRSIGDIPVRTDGLASRFAVAGCAVWFYLAKAIVPYKLAFVYPRWQIDPTAVISYLPAFALLVCFLVFWRFRKGWGRPFLAGLGYYVLTLLPVLGFLNIFFMLYSLVSDHWQYTPIAGVIALAIGLAAYGVARRPETWRRPGIVAAVVLVSLLAGLTVNQQSIYENSTALWRDTLAKNPKAWMAELNLGTILQDQGRLQEAMDHYRKALAEQPTDATIHYNLARAFAAQSQIPLAVDHYRKAIALDPKEWRSLINLGNILAAQGRPDEAFDCYRKAVDANPYSAGAHYSLGRAYLARKQYEQAKASLDQSLRLEPDTPDIHTCMGSVLIGLQQWPLAISHLELALRLDPNSLPAHSNLGLALLRAGRNHDAIPHFQAALNVMPNDAALRRYLALALAGQGQDPQSTTADEFADHPTPNVSSQPAR